MNIANLSLDSAGEKAQGINRTLISIVNQQEGGELKKVEAYERMCTYDPSRKRKIDILRQVTLHVHEQCSLLILLTEPSGS